VSLAPIEVAHQKKNCRVVGAAEVQH
jgi:hypothetical protein